MPVTHIRFSHCGRDAVGMGIPMGIRVWVWVWDGYGDCDESPWACGDSMGILFSKDVRLSGNALNSHQCRC